MDSHGKERHSEEGTAAIEPIILVLSLLLDSDTPPAAMHGKCSSFLGFSNENRSRCAYRKGDIATAGPGTEIENGPEQAVPIKHLATSQYML
ncbi:uncharacterized protein SPSK_03784 [Sporothrix schenckii 1099-18]|uniref:Uncharacterized protein n=1 Tax=Sporothrix schenckii 1099-18 TaxID=1397361 RepID=A0A0F2LY37_SPOSC|nr:uncharacterized protein SPSK_03784 [Sporothrix schenckii 1099-18]KJR82368.1 hypothetical protein SPSK_03784 [Sporothrix schenckii 1099-18]